MSDDDLDDFEEDEPEFDDSFLEASLKKGRRKKLDSRRRIEELQELRRMRELLADDDFEFDDS